MKTVGMTAAAAVLLAFPALALALGEEKFGNAPVVKQPQWAEGVLDAVNLESRVYSQWVNGNENFYFQGNARALNEALKKYAAIKADERRLVLLPGKGKTRSFGGKSVDFGWQLHVPSGIYLAVTKNKHAVMTVYIDAEKPRGEIDRKQAEKWIGELAENWFQKRQMATLELEKLGAAVKPLLREAMKKSPPLEVRRRIEAIVAKLGSIEVGDLEIPASVTAVTVDKLLEDNLKGLAHTDPTRCGIAMSGLVELAPYSDKVVPALTALLQQGKHEYLRRVAAHCLGRVGVAARPALPVLREGLEGADKNVRDAFKAAIGQIENAKTEAGRDEEIKRRRAILKDIIELKKAGGKENSSP